MGINFIETYVLKTVSKVFNIRVILARANPDTPRRRINMVGKLLRMKGGSRSTRPVSKRPPNWIIYQPDEVKALIINMAREGRTQSEIGMILRDEHGVPLVKTFLGMGIREVLEEAGVASEIPEDLYNLMVRANGLRRHVERNPKDYSNKRGLQRTESLIYRLTRFYKKKGILSEDWNYRREIITV
jgi:small subunit ribosomal protein S15